MRVLHAPIAFDEIVRESRVTFRDHCCPPRFTRREREELVNLVRPRPTEPGRLGIVVINWRGGRRCPASSRVTLPRRRDLRGRSASTPWSAGRSRARTFASGGRHDRHGRLVSCWRALDGQHVHDGEQRQQEYNAQRGQRSSLLWNERERVKDRENSDRTLAALGFGASAWKVAPRDEWIGWSTQQRTRNLIWWRITPAFQVVPGARRNLIEHLRERDPPVAKQVPLRFLRVIPQEAHLDDQFEKVAQENRCFQVIAGLVERVDGSDGVWRRDVAVRDEALNSTSICTHWFNVVNEVLEREQRIHRLRKVLVDAKNLSSCLDLRSLLCLPEVFPAH